MLTKEHVKIAVEAGRESQCLDGRDYSRLAYFFPADDWKIFGMELREGVKDIPPPRPWTEEEIKRQLADDVAFGFEKALDQRGISSSFMYEVVKMWMWILEDDLQNFEQYAEYGLPLFKAVALKYGFPNEIGEDSGAESRYSMG